MMCLDASTFYDLCEIYPESAKTIEKDASARH